MLEIQLNGCIINQFNTTRTFAINLADYLLKNFPVTNILWHKIYLPFIKGIKTLRL